MHTKFLAAAMLAWSLSFAAVQAQEATPPAVAPAADDPANKDLVRLSEKGEIWLDLKRKVVARRLAG